MKSLERHIEELLDFVPCVQWEVDGGWWGMEERCFWVDHQMGERPYNGLFF